MNSTPNEIQVQDIDHLGIVAGIVDEIGSEHKQGERSTRAALPN
jgi:hypothetical protein